MHRFFYSFWTLYIIFHYILFFKVHDIFNHFVRRKNVAQSFTWCLSVCICIMAVLSTCVLFVNLFPFLFLYWLVIYCVIGLFYQTVYVNYTFKLHVSLLTNIMQSFIKLFVSLSFVFRSEDQQELIHRLSFVLFCNCVYFVVNFAPHCIHQV